MIRKVIISDISPIIAALTLALTLVSFADAADSQEAPEVADAIAKLNAIAEPQSTTPTKIVYSSTRCARLEDGNAQSACWTAVTLQFDNYQNNLEIRNKAFRWQHRSSQMIFVIVHLIVIAGLYLSWRQFHIDLEMRQQWQKLRVDYMQKHPDSITNLTQEELSSAPAAAASATSATNISFSPKGVSMSSSVIGLIILGLSLGFFYLYLETVYPINVLKG